MDIAVKPEKEIPPAQREKHHSYDLRFKLRAVAAAKKSVTTAAVQEFGVDMTNKRPFRISAHLVKRPLYRLRYEINARVFNQVNTVCLFQSCMCLLFLNFSCFLMFLLGISLYNNYFCTEKEKGIELKKYLQCSKIARKSKKFGECITPIRYYAMNMYIYTVSVQGRRKGQGFGSWSPPSSEKTTLRAPPSPMTVFSLGITGID